MPSTSSPHTCTSDICIEFNLCHSRALKHMKSLQNDIKFVSLTLKYVIQRGFGLAHPHSLFVPTHSHRPSERRARGRFSHFKPILLNQITRIKSLLYMEYPARSCMCRTLCQDRGRVWGLISFIILRAIHLYIFVLIYQMSIFSPITKSPGVVFHLPVYLSAWCLPEIQCFNTHPYIQWTGDSSSIV